MDLDALRNTLEQASAVSLGIVFAAGFLFSFNPVALAAIPVSLAFVTKAHETRKAVLFGSMFISSNISGAPRAACCALKPWRSRR